jgi:hypothetical protein
VGVYIYLVSLQRRKGKKLCMEVKTDDVFT